MPVLLDTCAIVFLANGERIAPAERDAITAALADNGLWVCALSA